MQKKSLMNFRNKTGINFKRFSKKVTLILSLILLSQFMLDDSIMAQSSRSPQKPKTPNITLTNADIAMAKEVIEANTMTIPGYAIGSTRKLSPGDFNVTDALMLYMLKFHQQTKTCPTLAEINAAVVKTTESNIFRKAAVTFWKEYTTTSDFGKNLGNPDFLKSHFNWYILIKFNTKMKVINAREEASVASQEAWNRAMNSQQRTQDRTIERENENSLQRDANRAILNSQSAIDAAEKAINDGQ